MLKKFFIPKFFGIKWKLLVICIFLITAPTILLGFLSYRTFKDEAYRNMTKDLELISRDWQIMTEIYVQQMKRVLRREESLVEQRMQSISTTIVKSLEVAEAEYGKNPPPEKLNMIIDKIGQMKIGRGGYVFVMKSNGDMLLSKKRILDGSNIFQSKGKSFYILWQGVIDRAKALKPNDSFVIHYKWKDSDATEERYKLSGIAYFKPWDLIIGASTYYTDFKSYDLERILKNDFKEKIAKQRISANGYIWVIDSIGELVVSKNHLQDNENILDTRDDSGRFVIRDIIRNAKHLLPGETYQTTYTIQELGEKVPSRKIAVFTYNSDWDWIIGASAYEKDFLHGLRDIQGHIFRICLFFLVIGALVAYGFASITASPITALERLSNHAAQGNLDVKIDQHILARNDEIGRLAKSFQIMVFNLRTKIDQIEQSRTDLIKANQDLTDMQSKLLQSEKLAAIGQLAAGVAHEVNNPLGFIGGNLEVLERYTHLLIEILDSSDAVHRQAVATNLPDIKNLYQELESLKSKIDLKLIRDDIFALLKETKSGVDRIRKIVVDLRTFAHSDNGAMSPEDVKLIMDDMIHIVANEIKNKIRVTRHYRAVPKVLGNRQQLGQVFLNILINASQAISDKGKIDINIYATPDHVVVEIRDTGHGIPEKSIDQIFNPFFTTKDPGVGMGLGLSISYDIIKQHKGDIVVESQEGQGATFRVTLPIYRPGPTTSKT